MRGPLFATAAAACLGAGHAAAVTVRPDPKTTYGAWGGWGTSLAWFANVFGGRTDLARALYSLDDSVNVATSGGASVAVPGLGMTIARYNVGGCAWAAVNGSNMVASPNIPRWKQIPGYWVTPDAWDWTVDDNQRGFALAAQAAGATTFELFSNSPMWWHLVNHNPSGSADGGSDNLAAGHRQDHAHYMATVAAHFKATVDIAFDTVEAFNEPIANWWKATGTQEGCHFDVSTQADVLLRLRGELDAAGLNGTRIAASDESLTDQALSTWDGLNASARAVIDQVNVHGYQGTSGNRQGLYQAAVVQGGKALRMSEHGDGDASGATVATNAMLDFGALHPTSWVYWQALDGGGWGLLDSDVGNGNIAGVNPKWYVLAQLSRHVRPGDVVLSSGDPNGNTVVTWNATAATLTLVTWNPGSGAADVTFDLSAFGTAAGPAAGWVTAASTGGPKYEPTQAVPIGPGATLVVTIPGGSLATYVVAGVTA